MNKKLSDRDGTVITFYSYKGGVGRSMALANVSVLLAGWGYKVLVVDWDLEAPGLEDFYKDYLPTDEARKRSGMIDILEDIFSDKKLDWHQSVLSIPVMRKAPNASSIDIITSGVFDELYYDRVRAFDFNEFYERKDGGAKIEELRTAWKGEYDFVLIDSRTGVTDIGGICTIQLPDILVVLFTATENGFNNVRKLAVRAMKAQQELPFERVNLLVLPLATRMDNSEFRRSQAWINRFAEGLQEVYAPWINKEVACKDMIIHTKIPYISFFSFGETLPVIIEGVSDPASIGFAYQSVAALLATRLNESRLLIGNKRGLLIDLAESPGMAVESSASTVQAPSEFRRLKESVTDLFQWIGAWRYVSISLGWFAMALLVTYIAFYLDQRKDASDIRLERIQRTAAGDSVRHLQSLVDSLNIRNRMVEDNLLLMQERIKDWRFYEQFSKYQDTTYSMPKK